VDKLFKVISSCKTYDQLLIAKGYVALFCQMYQPRNAFDADVTARDIADVYGEQLKKISGSNKRPSL
jgi:hypothetical protein